MPRATVDFSETHRYDLKSLPEGFVVLSRLSYGQKLERQQISMEMQMRSQGKDAEGSFSIATTKVAQFDFKHCVVDHNLEDENGKKLNFAAPSDVDRLHPQIGEEVGDLIDKLNSFDGTEEAKN
jgi:hypothetical protein